MTTLTARASHGHAQPFLLPAVTAALHALSTWCERARQRRALLMLSDADLKDIGLSRCDALGESCRPFWQA
jgi:uncharacterized protein YjiS (DUF1127 family)